MSEHIDTYVIAVTIYHPKLIPLLQKIYIIILFSSVLTKQFHNLDEQSMHNTDLTLIFLMELNVQLSKKAWSILNKTNVYIRKSLLHARYLS